MARLVVRRMAVGKSSTARALPRYFDPFDGVHKSFGSARRAARCGSSGKRRNISEWLRVATEGRPPRPRGGPEPGAVLGRCAASPSEPRLPTGPWWTVKWFTISRKRSRLDALSPSLRLQDAAFSVCPIAVTQHTFVKFAGRQAWQFIFEINGPRAFLAG